MTLGSGDKNKIVPVSAGNRIDYMDLLRGLAIFFILIANLRWFCLFTPGFNGYFVFPEMDHLVHKLQHLFIEGKFYSIFSILFGWGIALQLKKSKKDDATTAKFIRRRLSFMLLLGGIHLFLIWEGDIVFLYGLVGFVLIALRNLSNRSLLITGALLLLSPIVLYFIKMNFSWFNWPSEYLTMAGEKFYQLNGWIDQDTSRTQVLKESKSIFTNIAITLGDAPYRFAYLFFVSRIPKVLGAMVIGFVIGRSEFYSKVLKHRKKTLWVSIIGLMVFVPLNYMLITYFEDSSAYYALQVKGLYYTIVYAFSVFPLALVYMLIIALLYENSVIQKLLKPVCAVGRTAFSNYIMHSVVGIIVFYGIGLGFMQQLGPLAWTIFAVILFSLQILVSNIWLRYFKFGPVEWIWRSLTYKKLQLLAV
ncbi:DUF418 domain-containing protein [Plebeiibacterium sediminum]|uniref:DUF418 domain-containing protein n=1 Tax=Plebeiibacterium sediminum TaxID=2992112 RepID=A0AAE3M542_9BACT|nr:DUF418 domain-containing protein [Plebeiobacterium sediminum]MCW3787294.1 DUF418 domain-containing protein [Plebeiobacterium sediminum]